MIDHKEKYQPQIAETLSRMTELLYVVIDHEQQSITILVHNLLQTRIKGYVAKHNLLFKWQSSTFCKEDLPQIVHLGKK